MILGLREEDQMPKSWIEADAVAKMRAQKGQVASPFGLTVAVVLTLTVTVLALAGLLGAFGLLLLAADWVGGLW